MAYFWFVLPNKEVMSIYTSPKSLLFRKSPAFLAYFSTTFLFLFLVLIFEVVSIMLSFKYDSATILLKTIAISICYSVCYGGLTAIIFLILDCISRLISKIIFILTLSIGIFLAIACQVYFLSTYTLLDHVVFTIKFSDLKETVINQISSVSYLFMLLLVPVAIFLTLNYVRKKTGNSFKYYFLMIPLLICLGSIRFIKPNINNYPKTKNYYEIENKPYYFVKTSLHYLKENKDTTQQQFPLREIREFQKENPREYINMQYPFVFNDNSEDVLGGLLQKPTQKPNFVFILIESLSRLQSGVNAQYGSFTPFLDSLSQHSLYWENCLSTSGRTFNAMPSIFGSLPYGKNGFTHLREKMPDHNTIIKVLNQNDYYSSFFYSDWYGFDDMDYFMKRQQIDYMIPSFGPKYKKMDNGEEGFSWGFPDVALYSRASEHLDSIGPEIPRIDIYQTTSSHEPWTYPDRERYKKEAKEVLRKHNKLNPDSEYFCLQFGAFIYVDSSLRKLFNYYKTRKDFENTIFVITGDHRPNVAFNNDLQTYHVPLIIYSKLVKRPMSFKGVTSHLAIAPTINSYLKNTLHFNVPLKNAWLGESLSSDTTFSCRISLPIMKPNRDFVEYVDNGYYLDDNLLYKIKPDFTMELIDNSEIQLRLKNKLQLFKTLNKYVCTFNRVYSESFNDLDFKQNQIKK